MQITLLAPHHYTHSGVATPMSAYIAYPGPAQQSYIQQTHGMPSYDVGQPGHPAARLPLI